RDFETFRSALSQLVLPALTLAIFSLAPIARMTRASMLAVLASDFIRTARASGLSPATVIVTYAFRNAMLPVITTLSMVFSFLLFDRLAFCCGVRAVCGPARSAGVGHRRGSETSVIGALVRHRPVGARHLQPRDRGHPARHHHSGGVGGAGVFDGRPRRNRGG